jgi:hypothetical protein
MFRAALFASSTLLIVSLAAACGDDDVAVDASIDLGVDLGRDLGLRDLGAVCAVTCVAGESCCLLADGGTGCVNLSSDIANCGICGSNCADGFGTLCFAGRCQCGDGVDGCNGTRGSSCCPARAAGERPYCASFDRDVRDCDGCGIACDGVRTDRCSAGTCYCGNRATTCDGTPESACCSDAFGDAACVNTQTSREHCGGCNIRCSSGESCETGVCTRGTACAGGCAGPDAFCCDGVCCARDFCLRGLCDADAGVDGGP